ncbi:MAG TPA: NAD(P)H-dependent glycerol-3-phosphate dehydrogenase [Chthoniobacterales bacterium]|nr:NAD(P)H-dependent glycerol-3-phosphate dehydrogenase [Chthoniobacterales bacterium]
MKRTVIVGAGSWGTALAALWAKDGRSISLWGNNAQRIARVQETRENADYLPGVPLPENVRATHELEDCQNADLIVFVTPSMAFRDTAARVRDASVKKSGTILLSCTKGIEHGSGMRMSEVLSEIFPPNPIAVLSGPNLAVEVVRGLPTATVIGSANENYAIELQRFLGSEHFRIYTSDDVVSIELGGALKNVFAIAAGVSDGLGLGDNSKAALITRALAELLRLGERMGGNERTFYGLSGVGDLIATCFSKHSRNRRVGERLGRAETLAQIQADMKMVAEGIPTAKSAFECARRLEVETPIIDQIYAILYQGQPLLLAMQELLGRDPKAERV